MLRLYLLCLAFFIDGLGVWMGERIDFFVGNGARYRGLFYGVSQTFEVIKTPYGSREFDE